MGEDAHPTTPTTQHGAATAGEGMPCCFPASLRVPKAERDTRTTMPARGSGKQGEKKSFKSRTQVRARPPPALATATDEVKTREAQMARGCQQQLHMLP